MERIIQGVHRLAHRSFRRACRIFCPPRDNRIGQKVICRPAQYQQSTEENTTEALLRPASTILIVNISNSTLIDCVIGNETYASAVAECQPSTQQSPLQMHDQTKCRCSLKQKWAADTCPPPPPRPPPPPSSAEPQNITIQSSHLSCVIIGDNNYMYAVTTSSTGTEVSQMSDLKHRTL